MNVFDVDVIVGRGNQISGNICYPDRGDEVTEDSIIVIPHGGEKYHVPGMKCKAIITEIGNRLCHLAIVTREQGKPMLKLFNAIEALKDTKRVWIRLPALGGQGVIAEVPAEGE